MTNDSTRQEFSRFQHFISHDRASPNPKNSKSSNFSNKYFRVSKYHPIEEGFILEKKKSYLTVYKRRIVHKFGCKKNSARKIVDRNSLRNRHGHSSQHCTQYWFCREEKLLRMRYKLITVRLNRIPYL